MCIERHVQVCQHQMAARGQTHWLITHHLLWPNEFVLPNTMAYSHKGCVGLSICQSVSHYSWHTRSDHIYCAWDMDTSASQTSVSIWIKVRALSGMDITSPQVRKCLANACRVQCLVRWHKCLPQSLWLVRHVLLGRVYLIVVVILLIVIQGIRSYAKAKLTRELDHKLGVKLVMDSTRDFLLRQRMKCRVTNVFTIWFQNLGSHSANSTRSGQAQLVPQALLGFNAVFHGNK